MTKYKFTRSVGKRERIEADRISFEPAHVAFWQRERLVLAVKNETCHDLTVDGDD
jgi:hypothetical protein